MCLKSRIKKLHDTALNCAAKSTNEQLSMAAIELKNLVPIDVSRPDYQTVVVELRKMAGLVCNNLEHDLCDNFSSLVFLELKVAASKMNASKELKKLKAGFGPTGGCGTVASFVEKKSSLWTLLWVPVASKCNK
jgi:hypothetical protein